MECLNSIRYGVCEDTYLHVLQNLSQKDVEFFRSFLSVIPKPPLNSSSVTKQEVLDLYALQQSERPQMRETIKVIDKELTKPFFNLCSMLKIDRLDLKVNQCVDFGQTVSLFYKAHFNRPRPFQVSLFYTSKFAPMGSISAWTASYPSGHTIQAEVIYRMYCKAYPQHASEFREVANLISYSRLVGGFHFQSDIEVGKYIVELLMGDKL